MGVVERVLRALGGLLRVQEGGRIAFLMRISECRETDLEEVARVVHVAESIPELLQASDMI